jgi:hypothetical protein
MPRIDNRDGIISMGIKPSKWDEGVPANTNPSKLDGVVRRYNYGKSERDVVSFNNSKKKVEDEKSIIALFFNFIKARFFKSENKQSYLIKKSR